MAAAAALMIGVLSPLEAAVAASNRIDLRVLVVNDGSAMVGAIVHQLDLEGVPHADVVLSDSSRPTINQDFLESGSEGFYQAVVMPNSSGTSYTSASLSADEVAALKTYESSFGVRQVDAYEIPGPQVGLHGYADPEWWAGDATGLSGTVTDDGKASGWGYLSGSVPFVTGTWAMLSTPLTDTSTPAIDPGASFTPYVTLPNAATGTAGSLIGDYRSASTEQLVITGAFGPELQHFRMLAHGIVSWMTKGVHFGLNRNYFTMHFDDAFGFDSRWDATDHCTPGEDCPATVTTTTPDIRMTAQDVDALVAWQQANGYKPTLAFNGYYAVNDNQGNPWNGSDALTNELVKNSASLRWLNHGYEHIYQGCQQDFAVIPWRCQTTDGLAPASDGSNIVWTPQSDITREISANAAEGKALGLSFDPTEYLSGEHSGLYLTPQQPVDNPNFAAALSENGVRSIGADASREPAQRTVGSALTVPRHPFAIYYNVATAAEEVSEYNWIYDSRANGGSGYCEDNPATATCLAAPLDPTTGFQSYIVPTDTQNDLRFVLSNDPRPFYAHVSNLAEDRLGLTLMSAILGRYRASFAANAPVMNQTLTEAATTLLRQTAWTGTGMVAGSPVSGYVQDGKVTIVNPTSVPAPFTAPVGTYLNGGTFGESYGGELSGWVSGNAALGTVAAPVFSGATAATFTVGTPGTVTIAAGTATSLTVTGTLPGGVAFADNGDGTATLSGIPVQGSAGTYPLQVRAWNDGGSSSETFTLTVVAAPVITSPSTATFTVGATGAFTVSATGTPAPAVALTGTLPTGLSFTTTQPGLGTISGRAASGTAGSYQVTVTATSSAGSVSQALKIVVQQAPTINGNTTPSFRAGTFNSFTIKSSGYPVPALTMTGTLPNGVTFVDNGNGTGTLSGVPAVGTGGVSSFSVKASNSVGSTSTTVTLTVQEAPWFTSAANGTSSVGSIFSFNVTTQAYPLASLKTTTSLPVGVTFRDNGNGTGTLSGRVTTAMSRTIGIRASNNMGSADQAFQLIIK